MAISPPALSIGGVELYRQDQFVRWHRGLCVPGDLFLEPMDLEGWGCPTPVGGWTTPSADGAWWCSTARPESTQVAGMMVELVEGLDVSTWTRELVDLALCGSVLGAATTKGRRITITGHVRALTHAALGHYLEALDYNLRTGFGCGDGCGDVGPDLRWLDTVPATTATGPQTALLERMIPNVGLLTPGLEVVQRWGSCCSGCAGSFARVRFTLGCSGDAIYMPARTFAGGCATAGMQEFSAGATCKRYRRIGQSLAFPPSAVITEVTGSGLGAPSAVITGVTVA